MNSIKGYTKVFMAEINKNPLVNLYLLISGILLLLFFLTVIITKGSTLYFAAFPDKDDIFMDYFNSIFDSREGHPYTVGHVIYPPLVVSFYGFLGDVIDFSLDIGSSIDLRDSYLGLFSYIFFVIVAILLIHSMIIKSMKNTQHGFKLDILVVFLLLSYPFMFAVMRGNSIVYVVLFIMIFLSGYKSEKGYIRYFSYICLGIATGIKIFPILFGLLVIRERNKRDVLSCLAICIILFLVPFVLTDGTVLDLIVNMLNNFQPNSTPGTIVNLHDVFSYLWYLGSDDSTINLATYVAAVILYVLAAVTIIFSREIKKWECVTLVVGILVLGFGTSVSYLPVYFIIAIAYFLGEEKDLNRKNIVFLVLFLLTMVTIPGFTTDWRDAGMTIRGVATIIITIMILGQYLVPAMKSIHLRRTSKVAGSNQDE